MCRFPSRRGGSTIKRTGGGIGRESNAENEPEGNAGRLSKNCVLEKNSGVPKRQRSNAGLAQELYLICPTDNVLKESRERTQQNGNRRLSECGKNKEKEPE